LDADHRRVCIHPDTQPHVGRGDLDRGVPQHQRLLELVHIERRFQPHAHATQLRQQVPRIERVDLAHVEHEVAVVLDPHVHAHIAVAERHGAEGIAAGRGPGHVGVVQRSHRAYRLVALDDRRGRLAGREIGEDERIDLAAEPVLAVEEPRGRREGQRLSGLVGLEGPHDRLRDLALGAALPAQRRHIHIVGRTLHRLRAGCEARIAVDEGAVVGHPQLHLVPPSGREPRQRELLRLRGLQVERVLHAARKQFVVGRREGWILVEGSKGLVEAMAVTGLPGVRSEDDPAHRDWAVRAERVCLDHPSIRRDVGIAGDIAHVLPCQRRRLSGEG